MEESEEETERKLLRKLFKKREKVSFHSRENLSFVVNEALDEP